MHSAFSNIHFTGILIDTVSSVKIITNPAKEQGFFSTYGWLISPIIVVLTFTFNIWYTARTKKHESERAWYLKAYFESQIKKVEEFFAAADKVVFEAVYQFSDLSKNGASDADRLDFVGKTLYELANLKRKFEIEVLEVLKYTYPAVFNRINDSILDFEDAGSSVFDDLNPETGYYNYIASINKIKARLLILLSEPALRYRQQKSKKSLARFLKTKGIKQGKKIN